MMAAKTQADTAIKRLVCLSLALASIPLSLAQARERKGVQLGGYPIANFSSDAGTTLGALAQRFDYGDGITPGPGARPFQSLLTLQSTYATQGPRDAWISYESFLDRSLDPAGWRWTAEFYAMDSEFSRYYGLGSESTRLTSLESQGYYFYDRRLFWLGGTLRKRVPRLAGIDLQAGIAQVSTRSEPGEGASGQSQYLNDFGAGAISNTYTQVSLKAIWERRNSEFIPTHGTFAMASVTGAPLAGWARTDFDLRKYFELLEGRRLWWATQLRYTGTGENTPLHEKARLGSLGTFRGVALNRYLSNHSVSLRNELRSVWFRGEVFSLPVKLGSGVFVDSGRIAPSLGDFGQSPTRLSWGFTLFGSYFTDDFLGSADFGFSKDGSSLYLRLGHAF